MDDDRSNRATTPAAPREDSGGGSSPFALYKPGMGVHVRWGSAAGGGLLSLSCALYLYESVMPRIQSLLGMRDASFELIRLIVPIVVLLGMVYLVWWLVGRKELTVNFLIATEGEMKKVNWSTRREIIGATRVVIFTMLVLASFLFVFDAIFIAFFSAIRVIKIDLGSFFGGGS